jgi:hypothetical protein
MLYADIHLDRERWQKDRILSFIEQRTAISGETDTGPTELSIVDVDM